MDCDGGTQQKEDILLVCISFKNNLKKVLAFLPLKGAGSTKPGEPSLAKFPGKFDNMCKRKVARPNIIKIISVNQTWWCHRQV